MLRLREARGVPKNWHHVVDGFKRRRVHELTERGVVIACLDAVEVGPDIDPDRIAAGRRHPRGLPDLRRTKPRSDPGARSGPRRPPTVENCQLGRRVQLKGGYFSGATFLDDSNIGSAAHVAAGHAAGGRGRAARTPSGSSRPFSCPSSPPAA